MSPAALIRIVFYTAVMMFAALSYRLGYSAGGDRELARAAAATVSASDDAQAAIAHRFAAYRLQVEALNARNQALEKQIGDDAQARRALYRGIRQEIIDAITKDLASGTGFGPEFVRVWDKALDPGRAAAAPPAGLPAGAAAAAVPAARIGQAQLLANHVDNAELCTDLRAQLNALISWHLENP